MPASRRPAASRSLLVIISMPSRPDALSFVATATGLALADVRLRLGGTLPRVLLFEPDAEHVRTLAAGLDARGFATLVCDAAAAPTDEDRIVARSLELSSTRLVVIDRRGARHTVLAETIALLQRGVRASSSQGTVTTRERQLSVGRALLSGGLMLSKQVQKTSAQVSESRESLLLVQRADDEPEIVLYERQLDYHFLGPELEPAAQRNLDVTTRHIRALAPHAPVEQTTMQPGFVQRLQPMALGDPLDLALYLVKLTHRRRQP